MGDPVPPMFWFRDPAGHTLMVVEQQTLSGIRPGRRRTAGASFHQCALLNRGDGPIRLLAREAKPTAMFSSKMPDAA